MVHVRRIALSGKEYRKVLTFAQLCYCCTILLISSVSKIYYLPFNKISPESKYHSNPMWGTLENWKLPLSFTTAVIGWNVLTQRKLCFKIEFNPFTPKSDLIDFTLSNTIRFYSSKGELLGAKELKNYLP